ncbi:hypothetical protein ACIA8K_28360 [Catenuloplanes sp. NPDC051500]|uniref:hypothetical protein n=1 Tax=Catenuloplanes sp. NPDC051500 TaxID=3363959 RepID=UPI0037933AD2
MTTPDRERPRLQGAGPAATRITVVRVGRKMISGSEGLDGRSSTTLTQRKA